MNSSLTKKYIIDQNNNLITDVALDNLVLSETKFCWLHYHIKSNDDIIPASKQIEKIVEIDELALSELFSDDSRPDYKHYLSGHLMIIRCINPNKDSHQDEMVPLHIWIKDRQIITVSYSNIYAIDNLHTDIENLGIQSRSEFLIELFTRIIDRIADVVDDIDDSIDLLDSELEDAEFSLSIEKLLKLRRRLLVLRRFTNPQKDLLSKVLKGTGINYDEAQGFVFRDLSDQYYKLIDDIDHLRDKLTLIAESVNNKRNESMNQTMYTMSIVASLFLPLGFLTGLLGVNVGGMPGVDSSSSFWILSLICILIIVIEVYILRKRNMI